MKLKLKTATIFLIMSMLSTTLAGCATNVNADDKTQPTTVSSESKTETEIEVNTKYITDENHEGAVNLPSEDGAKSDVDTSDYKNMEGYEAYISDRDTGYEGMEYFGTTEAIEESDEAYLYYKNNIRECGDYLITDYEDGVCINKYIGQGRKKDAWGSYNLDIPETLDGKPVVKIGSYIEDYDYENECYYDFVEFNPIDYYAHNVVSALSGWALDDLNLPKTIKYISKNALESWVGASTNDNDYYESACIDDINVSQDNPYYSSENGELFSKDKKTLLFSDFYDGVSTDYVVSSYVEHFYPINVISIPLGSVEFNKGIKKITAYVYTEDGESTLVKGYKGTVAEDWAKEQEAPFEAIG